MNLARVLLSRQLNTQQFDVYRKTGSFVSGGFQSISSSPEAFPIQGIVVPATDKEMKQLPEGDRIVGTMTFWSSTEIYTTRVGEDEGVSDELEWREERYKVLAVGMYVDYGFYYAIAHRMKGA